MLIFLARVQVIVPGVSWDCGRELIHYIYHDELSRTLNPVRFRCTVKQRQ